jgi:hypothetical protein
VSRSNDHPTSKEQDPVTTLARYRSVDGDRAVTLTVVDGVKRPFALVDCPADTTVAGTHFLLQSYASLEDAQEAAEAHADLAAELGTYEARAVHVGLCSLGDLR